MPVQARRAASTAASGTSSWQTTTSAERTTSPARSISAGDSFAFDPATTMIEFSAAASTMTRARPDGPSVTEKADTSTPSALRASARIWPAASSPRKPTKDTAAPIRAAACAWLLPLPPGPSEYAVASSVSPGRGSVVGDGHQVEVGASNDGHASAGGGHDCLPDVPATDRSATLRSFAEVTLTVGMQNLLHNLRCVEPRRESEWAARGCGSRKVSWGPAMRRTVEQPPTAIMDPFPYGWGNGPPAPPPSRRVNRGAEGVSRNAYEPQ